MPENNCIFRTDHSSQHQPFLCICLPSPGGWLMNTSILTWLECAKFLRLPYFIAFHICIVITGYNNNCNNNSNNNNSHIHWGLIIFQNLFQAVSIDNNIKFSQKAYEVGLQFSRFYKCKIK